MKQPGLRRRILALLALAASVLLLYFFIARPFQLRWGASNEEVQRSMPGDELNHTPDVLATRAITIQATPQQIWPWLMQMGYGRAGLYGYDLFRKFGDSNAQPGADRILPQFQEYHVGDTLPLGPVTTLQFQAIQPHEYIVWSDAAAHSVFTWALVPVDDAHTRLVSRMRRDVRWTHPGLLSLDLLGEFTDHLAMRRILLGIQGRAEGHIPPASDLQIEFFLQFGVLAAFIWAAISVLRLPLSLTSWCIGLAGGIAWLTAWYAPVSLWWGATLALLAVWAVRVEYRDVLRKKTAHEVKPIARPAKRR